MLTPQAPRELALALRGVLRDVAAPAVADDAFARAQVLSAASMANYLAAELDARASLAERFRRRAHDALADGSRAMQTTHPEVASALGLAATRVRGDACEPEIVDAVCHALESLRELGDDQAAIDARRGIQRALAATVDAEVAVFLSAEEAATVPAATPQAQDVAAEKTRQRGTAR